MRREQRKEREIETEERERERERERLVPLLTGLQQPHHAKENSQNPLVFFFTKHGQTRQKNKALSN